MRITESQLRRIVRTLVNEAAGEIPADVMTAIAVAAENIQGEIVVDKMTLDKLVPYKDNPGFSAALKKSGLNDGQVKQLMFSIKQSSAEVY